MLAGPLASTIKSADSVCVPLEVEISTPVMTFLPEVVRPTTGERLE